MDRTELELGDMSIWSSSGLFWIQWWNL